jgi:hypothetical protein
MSTSSAATFPRVVTPPSVRRPGLRLIDAGGDARFVEGDPVERYADGAPTLFVVPDRARSTRTRCRVSPEVRRRRTLLAAAGLLLIALALPLGGIGGNSHPTDSALAGNGHPVAYVVQPGDSLWSIAHRVNPSGDPRPLVAKLAAQVGSDTVVPGERIVLP